MAADRPLQGAIDSGLELCVFPLLGRQDPDAQLARGAFVGTPIYNVYLRLMGAKIGRNVILNTGSFRSAPISSRSATTRILSKDMISSATGAVELHLYRAGQIGGNAFVGEASVIDIDTAMEDDTQLGHASSLQSGQRVPDGKHYHGSPAHETTANYCPIEPQTALRSAASLYVSLSPREPAHGRRACYVSRTLLCLVPYFTGYTNAARYCIGDLPSMSTPHAARSLGGLFSVRSASD